MGFLNCPNCAKRLRVPDSPAPMELRCPACRQSFRSGGAAVEEEAPAPGPATPRESSFAGPDQANGPILSQADEAMLRDYGSGSPRLELTREAFTDPSTATPSHAASAPVPVEAAPWSDPASAPADSEAEAQPPAQSNEEPDRQFQIVGTALAMANTLAQAHKAELTRTRRQAALGWALLALVALAAGAAGWWGMTQAGQVQVERQKVAGLTEKLGDANARLAELKNDVPRIAEDLSAALNEHRALQADLAAERDKRRDATTQLADARKSLTEKKDAADALAAELKSANARIASLSAEAQRLRKNLAAARASQPALADANAAPAPRPPEAMRTLASQPATAPAASTAVRPAKPIFSPPSSVSPAGSDFPGR